MADRKRRQSHQTATTDLIFEPPEVGSAPKTDRPRARLTIPRWPMAQRRLVASLRAFLGLSRSAIDR